MDAKPRLMDQMRDRPRTLHYSFRTEQQYLFWVRRFVVFSSRRHPATMGATEVEGRVPRSGVRVVSPDQVGLVLS